MNNEEKKYIKLTPFKMQILQSFPFIDADFDALTNYELLCKVVDYLNKTIDNVDVLNDEVEEYINKFNELKAYVDNYFDNLDVQEEINNKLDEMAESGELTDIIAQYLGLAGMFVFNNVNDMKQATNLVNGSTCQTLGFYEINDGGKAIYKIRNITNEDIVDNMFIISLNNENLIAQLIITNYVNVKTIGAKGDNNNDDSDIIQHGIDYCINSNFKTLYIPKGIYYLSKPIKTETIISSQGNPLGYGITIKGENGSILTRKHNDITPPSNSNEDYNNCCLAITGNNNIIENLQFDQSKIGLYIGQDITDLTGKTNAHFNKIKNIVCSNCGIGIDLVAGYGNYYNNIDNFKIYYGNIGIDFKKFNPSSSSTDVSNRNNFSNGEINKCYAGVHITSGRDTNMFNNVHFEQISTEYGYGTQPSWLPDNEGVALLFGGRSNMATNCVCEECDNDLYDNGYDNRYLYDVFDITKINVDNSQYLGTTMVNTASSNTYFNKIGSMIQQSENIINNIPAWTNTFGRPIVSKNNIYDYQYSDLLVNLSSKVDTTDFNISYIGGTTSDSSDNVYFHKKIGKINYLYIKGQFYTDSSSANKVLKINLPITIINKFSNYSNRIPYRFPVIVNSNITIATIRSGQLQINPPTNGWGQTQSNYTTLDVNITYPSSD